MTDYSVEERGEMEEATGVTAVIRQARQLLQAGWCQGEGRRQDDGEEVPRYCAVAALAVAIEGLRPRVLDDDRLGEAAHQVLRAIGPLKGKATPGQWAPDESRLPKTTVGQCRLMAWNDDPTRTHEEVLRAFDKAAGGK